MKKLNFNGQIFESERIIKTNDSIIGYNGDVVVFKFSGISDFSGFTLADGQMFDEPIISDAERITELEQIINMLLMGEM